MPTARDAITALIYTYAERLDAGDLRGVATLFDGATYGSAAGERRHGSAEVLAVLTRKVLLHADGTPRTKHVTTNLIIDIDPAAASATARSYFSVLQAADGLALQVIIAGRYHDRFVQADGIWRFADRVIFVDLVGDLSQHLQS
jgi:hypothetical protein